MRTLQSSLEQRSLLQSRLEQTFHAGHFVIPQLRHRPIRVLRRADPNIYMRQPCYLTYQSYLSQPRTNNPLQIELLLYFFANNVIRLTIRCM